MKTTSPDLFRARENTEMMGLMQLKEKGENPSSGGGKVWVHRTALKDTARMLVF